MGFIIKTVSEVTGRYVDISNDDAFSVALIAFNEAIEKHDPARGPFLAFAKIVIRSRVLTYLEGTNKTRGEASLNKMLDEDGYDAPDESANPDIAMRSEIEAWKSDLAEFKITVEALVENAPKHEDTRKRAIDISEKASKDHQVTEHLFTKKRLPIRLISRNLSITEKIIKGSKLFITSVIVIFVKDYHLILDWIRG